VQRLPADAGAARPERLYLDLEGVWVGRRYGEPIPVGDQLLQGVRVGQNTLSTTRVVIDLKRYSRHRLIVLTAPHRVVVDVFGRPSAARAGPPVRPDATEERPDFGGGPVRRVVLDPGHGGRDPGANGGRLREKDVTLALAHRLRKRLLRDGFEVILTREGDETVSLEERTARAEGAGGDVFISLHANAAPRRGVEGIETYYLNENYERHSVTVAARENGIPRGDVDALQRTLAQLRVSAVSEHSARLAGAVHRGMVGQVRGRVGPVTDLGVKRGPFYVLFLSSMPSVLLEVGFITNGKEAARLRDPTYQEVLADAIAEGIGRYRDLAEPRLARGGAR
jgi:N-acetylmuramoyl-L-alanine amidase